MQKHHLIFIIIFSLIVLLIAFYWLFANAAKPIVFGMPFGMFVIVALIIAEFFALLGLYYFDELKPKQKERK
jgi:hypothetical protein